MSDISSAYTDQSMQPQQPAVRASDLKELAESYIACVENIKRSGASPEVRKRRGIIQEQIAKAMIERSLTYIQVGHKYIVLKPKYKKPAFNPEFLAKGYYQFHSNPTNVRGKSPEELAEAFATGIFAARNNMSSKQPNIAITDSVPLSARLSSNNWSF